MTRSTILAAVVTASVLLVAPCAMGLGATGLAATVRPGGTARTTMGHAGVTTGTRARGGAAGVGTMTAPAHRNGGGGPGGRR